MQFGFKLITRALMAEVCLLGSKQRSAAYAEITQRRKAGLNFISKMGVTQSLASPED